MVGPDDDLDELKEEVSEGFDARRSLQFLATSDGSEGSTGCKQQPFFCPEFGQNTANQSRSTKHTQFESKSSYNIANLRARRNSFELPCHPLSAWELVHSRALAQESILNDFEKEPAGVYVKASTLGSLEALLSFLQEGAGCAPGGAALVCGSPIFVVI